LVELADILDVAPYGGESSVGRPLDAVARSRRPASSTRSAAPN